LKLHTVAYQVSISIYYLQVILKDHVVIPVAICNTVAPVAVVPTWIVFLVLLYTYLTTLRLPDAIAE